MMANETILVVDDSEQIREFLIEYILLPAGYKVFFATDGEVGLEMALEHQPDLIMTDMSMPRMTGLELLSALRDKNCQAPVIFMTLHGSEGIAVEAFRLGVKDYLTKPFTIEEAEWAINRSLKEVR
jgi:two-component system NtrC family sensor kinase